MLVTVQGGTDAGKRVVKEHRPWFCACHDDGHRVLHPGDRYSCPDCGARRPT